jgi:uncharacterized protein (DUF1684 family)
MAVTVIKDSNILTIDDGVKIKYWNAGWVSMEFDDSGVRLINSGAGENPVYISFSDFTNDVATNLASESAIFDYLKDKIG